MHSLRSHRRRARIALLTITTLVLAACGSDGGSTDGDRNDRNSAIATRVSVETYSSDAGQTYPVDLVFTEDGSRYVLGDFQGTVDFDSSATDVSFTSEGILNMFLAKHDASGALLWVKEWQSTSGVTGTDLDLDLNGNVVIVGTFRGDGDLDPGPGEVPVKTMTTNMFVEKLNGDGEYMWSHIISGPIVSAVGTTSNDSIVVAGSFSGTIDFDTSSGTSNLTSDMSRSRRFGLDVFVMTINSDGKLESAIRYGGANHEYVYGLTIDSDDNTYLVGASGGSTEFGTTDAPLPLVASPVDASRIGYVAKIDSAGSAQWIRGIGGSHSSLAYDINIGNDGMLRVVGAATEQTVDGTVPMTLAFYSSSTEIPTISTTTLNGMSVGVLGVLNSDGVPQRLMTWGETIATAYASVASATNVTSDGDGNTYVALQYAGSIRLSPDGVASHEVTSTSSASVLYKLNTSYEVEWFAPFASLDDVSSATQISSVSINSTGNPMVFTYGSGPIDFNPLGISTTMDAGFDSYSSYFVTIDASGPVAASTGSTSPPVTETTIPPVSSEAAIEPTISVVTSPMAFRVSQPLTAAEVAGLIGLKYKPKSKLTMKVASSSAKTCVVSRKLLTALKTGRCKVTITAKPKTGKSKTKTGTITANP